MKRNGNYDVDGNLNVDGSVNVDGMLTAAGIVDSAPATTTAYAVTDADQTGIAAETAIQIDSPDTGEGRLIPGADGIKNYWLTGSLAIQAVGNSAGGLVRVRVGTAGTTSDAVVYTTKQIVTINTQNPVVIHCRIAAPAENTLFTITVEETDFAGTFTVHGSTYPSYFRIEQE